MSFKSRNISTVFSRFRFYFYQGRIKATQLDYSEAHKYLVQSSRKAPQNSANGFKQHVTKLSITVELLLGNIPERQAFLVKYVSLYLGEHGLFVMNFIMNDFS